MDTPPIETFHERLQRAAKSRNFLSANQLAGELGVSAPGPTSWWYGPSFPNFENLVKLTNLLRVDGHWLLTGDGDMERPQPDEDRWRLGMVRDALAAPYPPTGESESPPAGGQDLGSGPEGERTA